MIKDRSASSIPVLVDTSIWISHLRSAHRHLQDLLRMNRAVIHPFIIEELACGGLDRAGETLEMLRSLPLIPPVSHLEFLDFLQSEDFRSVGLELVDTHLLISAKTQGLLLWTFDRRLRNVAMRLHLGYTWK